MSNNFAVSALTNDPGTSGTSFTVTTGTGARFVAGKATVGPATGDWTPANAEVVTITNVSSDTLTVTRGSESSTAQTLAVGYRIVQGVTAGMYDALVTADSANTAAAAAAQSTADGALVKSANLSDLTNRVSARTVLGLPAGTPTVGQSAVVTTPSPLVMDWATPAGGGLPSSFVTKTTTYSAAVGEFVQADASSAAFTVTLPASPAAGSLVAVKKTDSSANVVTVAPASGTIDGDPNATIVSQNAGGVFEYSGSNWRVASTMLSGSGSSVVTTAVGPNDRRNGTGAPIASLPRTINWDTATALAGSQTFVAVPVPVSGSFTRMRAVTGSTAAGTITAVQFAVYTMDASGNLTLVTSSPSDTAVFSATSTGYTKTLSATVTVTAGQVIVLSVAVAATTKPALLGQTVGSLVFSSAIAGTVAADRKAGSATVAYTGTLPSSVTAAQWANAVTSIPYIELLP